MKLNGIISFGEKQEENKEQVVNTDAYLKFKDNVTVKMVPLRRWTTDITDDLGVQRFPRHSVFTKDGKGFYAVCIRGVEGVDSCPICDYANYLKNKDSEKYKAVYSGLWARVTYSLNVLTPHEETGEWVEKLWFFGAKVKETLSDIAATAASQAAKYKDAEGAKNNILGQILEVNRTGKGLETEYNIRLSTNELSEVGIKKLPEMTLMLEDYLGITDPATMLNRLADIGYVIPNETAPVVNKGDLDLSKL